LRPRALLELSQYVINSLALVVLRKATLRITFVSCCKKAKLQARIKPTALCSAIDKENSIEFPLYFLHYLYNYYMVVRATGHKTPGESSVNITVSVYDTTHLQENPQRIG